MFQKTTPTPNGLHSKPPCKHLIMKISKRKLAATLSLVGLGVIIVNQFVPIQSYEGVDLDYRSELCRSDEIGPMEQRYHIVKGELATYDQAHKDLSILGNDTRVAPCHKTRIKLFL